MPLHVDPSTPEGKMIIEILLKDEEARKQLQGIEQEFVTTGGKIEESASRIEQLLSLGAAASALRSIGSDLKNFAGGLNDLAQDWGRHSALVKTFDANLRELGKAPDDFIADMEKVTKGGLTKDAIREMTNLGLALGIPADSFEDLAVISKIAARELGESTEYMMESITRGIGQEAPMMLDNLGIKLRNAKDIYRDYAIEVLGAAADDAKAIKQVVDAMTNEERKRAIVMEIKKKYVKQIEEEKERTADLSDTIESLNKKMADFADSGLGKSIQGFGQLAGGTLQTSVNAALLIKALSGPTGVIAMLKGATLGTVAWGAALSALPIMVIVAELIALEEIIRRTINAYADLEREQKRAQAIHQEVLEVNPRARVFAEDMGYKTGGEMAIEAGVAGGIGLVTGPIGGATAAGVWTARNWADLFNLLTHRGGRLMVETNDVGAARIRQGARNEM